MKNAFKIKHDLVSCICNFKQGTAASRSIMFHDVQKTKGSKDLYTLDLLNFIKFMDLAKKLKKIVPFNSQDFSMVDSLSITFDDGYVGNLEIVAPELFMRQVPFTIFMISDFVDSKYGDYLDKTQLRELAESPLVTIGAHGKTHRPLATLSFDEAREEIRVSKIELENLLGKAVETMSFPHGSFNKKLLEAASEIGYKRCGTSVPLGNSLTADFMVNRQCIFSCDSPRTFEQKVLGQWDWVWSKAPKVEIDSIFNN